MADLNVMTDLNVRPETLQLLEENIGRTLFDKILYDLTLRVMEIKAKVNMCDLVNLKSFAQQRKL